MNVISHILLDGSCMKLTLFQSMKIYTIFHMGHVNRFVLKLYSYRTHYLQPNKDESLQIITLLISEIFFARTHSMQMRQNGSLK